MYYVILTNNLGFSLFVVQQALSLFLLLFFF